MAFEKVRDPKDRDAPLPRERLDREEALAHVLRSIGVSGPSSDGQKGVKDYQAHARPL